MKNGYNVAFFPHVVNVAFPVTRRWYRIGLDPQVPRLSHAAVCVGSYLFVTGGHDGTHYCSDLLMLNFGKISIEGDISSFPILLTVVLS